MLKNFEKANLIKTNNTPLTPLIVSKKPQHNKTRLRSFSFLQTINNDQLQETHKQQIIRNTTNFKEITKDHEEILINELKKPQQIMRGVKIDIPETNNYNNNNRVSVPNFPQKQFKRNTELISLILSHYRKIQQYAKINSFGEEFIKILSHLATTEHFPKGTAIYKMNSKSLYFYFIIRGSVSIRTIEPDKIKDEMNNKEDIYQKITELDNEIKLNMYFDNINYSDDDEISLSNLVSDSDKKIIEINEKNFNINNSFSDSENSNKNQNNNKILTKRRSSIFDRIKQKVRHGTDRFSNQFNNTNISKYQKNLLELQKNLACEIKVIQKGKFFGEWDIIFNHLRSNSAFANEDTDLMLLSKNYFDKFFSRHLCKADIDRKFFITKRIPLLKIEHLLHLQSEFFDKNALVYTQYDTADEFFIIYQGSGELKKLKNNHKCKCKHDIIFHKDDLETVCIVDKGCIVGLEAGMEKQCKYEYNFVITEENTVLYRIPLSENKTKFNKNFRMQLKSFLVSLYEKQYNFLEERKFIINNYKKKKEEKNDEEDKYEKLFNLVKKEYRLSRNKPNNLMETKTQVFNFLDAKAKNQINNILANNIKKLPKILLFKQYFEQSSKKHKNKKSKKNTNIFMTNINKKNKNKIKNNLDSVEKNQNKKNKTPTLMKEIKEQQKNINNNKNEILMKINLTKNQNKDKIRLLTSPNIIKYNKLTSSTRNLSHINKIPNTHSNYSNSSKFINNPYNFSDKDINNRKNNFIVNQKNYLINKLPISLDSKLKTRNLDNKDKENNLKYTSEDFRTSLIKSKMKFSKNI